MRNSYSLHLLRFLPVVIGLSIVTGCASVNRHVSVLSPGALTHAKDFDVDNLPRYRDTACAYRVAVHEKVADMNTSPGAKAGPLKCLLDQAVNDQIAKPENAKVLRNQIVDDLRTNIDHVYNEYLQVLYTGKGVEGLAFDITNLGLTAASTITLVSRTKTILSALATGLGGVGLSVDKNFFGQQTFAALAAAMQARRDLARNTILKNEQLGVDVYSLDMARDDLVAYFYCGTLPGAIQEVQQEASAKSTAVTAGAAASTAAKLAFTGTPASGATGAPIAIEVQVQDSSGVLVASATNSIALTAPPSSGASGNLTQSAAAGVAVFYLTFAATGSVQLSASSNGLQNATSSPIQIATPPTRRGSATALEFVKPSPTWVLHGIPGSPVTVMVKVMSGDVLVNDDNRKITISSSPAGATNSTGDLTVAAQNGVASFNLSFAAAGSYSLTATGGGLSPASGVSVSIAAPASATLPVTTVGIH